MPDFWNQSGPLHPWGPFNCAPGASLNFTYNAAAWLSKSGTGLTLDEAGSGVDVEAPLVKAAQAFAGSLITARIELDPDAVIGAAQVGQFVPLRVNFKASDGQHDARTYYLRLEPR